MDENVTPIDPINIASTTDALWEDLAATNREGLPHTVARFGRLCMFGRDDASGALELHEYDLDTLRYQLTRKLNPVQAVFVGGVPNVLTDDMGAPKRAKIPNEAIQALLKRPLDKLDEIAYVPRVDRVVDVPVFAPDGQLVEKPGHHPAARTFYDGDAIQGLTHDWEDERVRKYDVDAARETLLASVSDFPFADQASRAHALCLMVEQFARSMVAGPTPAYVIIAAEQGTGKSLLAQACLYPSCGKIDLTPEPELNPQDFQKRLLSELIRGPQAIVFDNVTRPLENSTLAAMLTSGRYADRVLGKSQILSFPIRHTTVFTMNNPEIGPDMRRRVVPIYLDAGVEKPWERIGPGAGRKWRHPNLLEWIEGQRDELVRAAITLVKNYHLGQKEVDLMGEEYIRREVPPRVHGSFAAWSHVMGGVVTAAGVPGFGGNLDRLYDEQSDDDADEAVFLEDWPDGRRMTAAEVLQWVTVGLDGGLRQGEAPPSLRNRFDKLDHQSVGIGLRGLRGKVRNGRRLMNDRSARPTMWYVEEAK